MFDASHRRGHTSRLITLVTLLGLLGLLSAATPVVIAQEGTPASDTGAVEATEVPTEVPTEIPTEAPTQIATEIATEAPGTDIQAARGVSITSAEPTDETPILPNTDSLAANGAAGPVALDPGQQATFAFSYYVTTYRTGTAIHAELRHTDGSLASGWGLSADAGGSGWVGGAGAVDVGEWGTLVPDTAFTLSVIVTAPASADAEQTVSLWINSTASTARGETETGLYERGPLATATVVPPPVPNTDSLAATSSTEPVTLEPGGSQQYNFTYAVTTPRTATGIVADLRLPDGNPAAGWTISALAGGGEAATGDARVETGEWATLAPGSFALTVTVTAPADIAAEQTVTLWIASTTTTDLGVENAVAASAPLATLTITPPPSEIVAEVAAEPMVVEEAPVTCDVAEDAAPWIVTDLADYPPGALVTLTGGSWVPGQTIEILVEDDGVADAERGEWSHTATVTADEGGGFTYQFNLAPWYVADYTVVATGECSEAATSFTDAGTASVTIEPPNVEAGTSANGFTITVKNTTLGPTTKDTEIRSIDITIAEGFTNIQDLSASSTDLGQPTYVTSTRTISLKTGNNGNGTGIDHGESVKLTFTADAPLTPGTPTWTVVVTNSKDPGGTSFSIQVPTVTVEGPELPDCMPSLTLTSLNFANASTWDGSAWSTESGTMGIRVDNIDASCTKPTDGWTISAKIQAPLTGPNGGEIPATNLSYDHTNNGTPPSGINPMTGGGTLESQVQIATVTSDFESDDTEWNAGFSIAPSAGGNAPPAGSYNGEITISIIDAP